MPWPRVAWQSAHISTVNKPSIWLNGPVVEPQNEQRAAIRVPDAGSGVDGPGASAGDVAAPDPAVGLGAELAPELHEAPDLGAIHPGVGFDVESRPEDGGQVDAEQLGAPLQWGGDRPGEGRIVGFPGLYDRLG